MTVINPRTGEVVALEGWQSIDIVETFDGTTGTINGLSVQPAFAAMRELSTELLIAFHRQLCYRLRVIDITDDFTANDHTVSVTCVGWENLLQRRILYLPRTYTNLDQHLWAWELIFFTQTLEDLGIRQAADFALSGVLRTQTVQRGQTIAEAIDTIAGSSNGFDWWIDEYLKLHAQTPRRLNPIDLDIAWGSGAMTVTRATATENYASSILAIGATNDTVIDGVTYPPPTPQIRELSDMNPFGRWERTVFYNDIVTNASLGEKALWHLSDSMTLRPTYDIDLTPGVWQPNMRPGTTFTLRVKSPPRLDFRVKVRIETLSISLDTNGTESVQVSCRAEQAEFDMLPRGISKYLIPAVSTVTTPFRPVPANFFLSAAVRKTALSGVPETIAAQAGMAGSDVGWQWRISADGSHEFHYSVDGTTAGPTIVAATPTEMNERYDPNADFYIGFSFIRDPTETYVQSWLSYDGVNWNGFGNVGVGAHPAVFSSTAPVRIGGFGASQTDRWDGRIYWVEMRDHPLPGFGDVVWRFDSEDWTTGLSYTDPRGGSGRCRWRRWSIRPAI